MKSQFLSQNGNRKVTSSVCICTCRRPEGLRKLLASLAEQVGAPDFEIVVADHDTDGSARAVVDSFSGSLGLTYAVEPENGLAAIRNCSVRMARGEFLAFVDDDETVGPDWLAALHRTMIATGAAGVFGPVEVEFEGGVAEMIRSCRFFACATRPEGAPLRWEFTRTSNAYVRRSALPDPNAPFRAAFGQTGGEDIDLFKRMADAGCVLVAAGPAARAREFREVARANLAWVMRRGMRNGGNLADLQWVGVSRGRRLRLAMDALGHAARHGVIAMKESRRDKLRFVEQCIDAAEYAGRCLSVLGYRYAEYGSRR